VKILQIGGAIAGIAGLSISVFLLIVRAILARVDWPKLTKEQSFRLLNRVLVLSISVVVTGTVAWLGSQLLDGATELAKSGIQATTRKSTVTVVDRKTGGTATQVIEEGGNFTLGLNSSSSHLLLKNEPAKGDHNDSLGIKESLDSQIYTAAWEQLQDGRSVESRQLACEVLLTMKQPLSELNVSMVEKFLKYAAAPGKQTKLQGANITYVLTSAQDASGISTYSAIRSDDSTKLK